MFKRLSLTLFFLSLPVLAFPQAEVVPDASMVDTDTTDFNTNLSSADNTVQKALDVLDDLGGTTGFGTTNPKGILVIQTGNTATNYAATVVDSNGNIGIGTSAPQGLLHIVSATTAPNWIVNSNVGIGVSSPGALLQIKQILITGDTKAAYALCLTTTGTLGYCSSVVGVDGTCTCTNAM